MPMELAQRTFVCGVVSVDLVGYSKLPVSEQTQLKARFNASLTDTLAPIAADSRIILDTGDGVVVGFLEDPEDGLYFAMALSRASEVTARDNGQGRLRIGINLGPVRLGTDLNKHPTVVGDGVNVAEQIMSFAWPGTVVASRAFHDFAVRISDTFESLFHFEGSRTDKHVRDHDVYTVRDDDDVFEAVRRGVLERAGLLPPEKTPPPAVAQPSPTIPAPTTPATPVAGPAAAFLGDPAKVAFAAMLLAAIALLEGYLLWNKLRARSTTAPPGQISTAPSVSPPFAAPPVPAATGSKPVEPSTVQPAPQPEAKVASAPEKTMPSLQLPVPRGPTPDSKPNAPAPASAVIPATEGKRVPDIRKPSEFATEPKRAPRKNEPTPKAADPPAAQSVAPPSYSPPATPAPTPAPMLQPAPQPAARALEPISRTPPEFPVAAVRQGVSEGRVKARATIDAAGTVMSVDILSAYPQRLFDRAVVDSVSKWKFPPGTDRRSYEVDVEFKR